MKHNDRKTIIFTEKNAVLVGQMTTASVIDRAPLSAKPIEVPRFRPEVIEKPSSFLKNLFRLS